MIALYHILKEEFQLIFAINSPSKQVIDLLNEHKISFEDVSKYNNDFEYFEQAKLDNQLDCLILDGYHFKKEYQFELKKMDIQIVSIDGVYNTHFYSDIVINYNIYADKDKYSAESYTGFYMGTDYCFLRKSFLDYAKKNRNFDNRKNLTIMFGGSDQNNLSLTTLRLLNQSLLLSLFECTNIICGNSYIHKNELGAFVETLDAKVNILYNLNDNELINIFSEAKLAIIPGGYSLYEIFSVGVPVITGYYVDNQGFNAEYVGKNKLGQNIGDFNKLDSELLKKSVYQAIGNTQLYVKNQFRTIDGNQEKRLINIFQNIINNQKN